MREDTVASTRDAWERRRTWITGGVLLLLSVAVQLVARGPLVGISPGWALVWTPLTYLVGLYLFSSMPAPVASFGALFSLYAPAAGTAFLGALSILLGLRSSAHVFPPRTTAQGDRMAAGTPPGS